jgi:hypothetical protein
MFSSIERLLLLTNVPVDLGQVEVVAFPRSSLDGLLRKHRLAIFGSQQVDAVSITLQDAVNKYSDCEAFIDVAFRLDVQVEFLWSVSRYGNVCLNNAVSIGRSDLSELGPLRPEDMTSDSLQTRHFEVIVCRPIKPSGQVQLKKSIRTSRALTQRRKAMFTEIRAELNE